MSWEAMERGSGLLVLILVLEPFLLRFFLNKRGGGGRRGRNIEALDQFSQHRSDPKEQLLAFVDLSSTANGLRDQRIQTCRAFSSRTTCSSQFSIRFLVMEDPSNGEDEDDYEDENDRRQCIVRRFRAL